MATLAALRAGLAANLATITALQTSAYQLGNPTPPTAWVAPGDPLLEFDQTMGRGRDLWHLVVEVFVSLTSDKGAQKRLDAYLAGSGATSIKTAIESDRTLGGACDNLRLTHIDGVGDYQLGERGAVLGFRAHVDIYATG